MNAESLALLEYETLKSLIRRWVASDGGRNLLDEVQPSANRAGAEAQLAETAEAMAWIDETVLPKTRGGEAPVRLSFDGLPETGTTLAKLRIQGSVLEALELQAVIAVLEKAEQVRQALKPHAQTFPLLAARAATIADFREAVKAVSGKILPDGTISDHASPALAKIRREMERQRREIHSSLERFLKLHRDDGMLQEEFVTIRNDRFVVPVLPGAKKRAAGVVHGSSGSGHTLFLEPLETIELNNDLVRLTDDEMREVRRILAELTDRLRAQSREIGAAAVALAALDFAFAKARFAEAFDCVIPTFSPDEAPVLKLKRARHPLLQDVLRRKRMQVVPVSFELDSRNRSLLISGPNTGGKTVTLKTAGLLVLMAQSGFPVPADEAVLPVFDDVLADIGDNQSIEQSLSSFSAHVTRVKEIVEAGAPGVLVLLDELGRATDPEEGGALGVAVLDEFNRFGAFTLASTHLLALKVYGATTAGVVNASMGFNEETLEPTYELRTGAPGKSAGLDIASRLGLPQRLIDRARAAMSDTERDIAHFLKELETKVAEAREEAAALRRRQLELEAREKQLVAELEKRESRRVREIEDRAEKAMRTFEQEARDAIGRASAVPETRRQAERAQRDMARARREMKEEFTALAQGKAEPAKPSLENLAPGMRVKLKDLSQPAKVLRVMGGGMVEVEVGFLKMQAPTGDIREVLPESSGQGKRLPQGVSFTAGPRYETLASELNIIGKTSDEAEVELERFIDGCALADVTRVRIVHGHGMGILKKMVQQLLSKHPHVDNFGPATPAEGGTGATIAELKSL
ncbi:MAG: Smr/MutS family protein [Bryobacteraceae bacterium]|nr:Smr/MutS family protein [Bryobacteraceae bacterium]